MGQLALMPGNGVHTVQIANLLKMESLVIILPVGVMQSIAPFYVGLGKPIKTVEAIFYFSSDFRENLLRKYEIS